MPPPAGAAATAASSCRRCAASAACSAGSAAAAARLRSSALPAAADRACQAASCEPPLTSCLNAAVIICRPCAASPCTSRHSVNGRGTSSAARCTCCSCVWRHWTSSCARRASSATSWSCGVAAQQGGHQCSGKRGMCLAGKPELPLWQQRVQSVDGTPPTLLTCAAAAFQPRG
jgi:hypothetical protein